MARCHTSYKCIMSRTDLKNICNVMIDSNESIHTFKENGRDFITDIYTYWFVWTYWFHREYKSYIKNCPSIEQGGICDGRSSPFTFLLTRLGYTDLLYEGDVAFYNNRERRGGILFDVDQWAGFAYLHIFSCVSGSVYSHTEVSTRQTPSFNAHPTGYIHCIHL